MFPEKSHSTAQKRDPHSPLTDKKDAKATRQTRKRTEELRGRWKAVREDGMLGMFINLRCRLYV